MWKFTVSICGHSAGVTSLPLFHRGYMVVHSGQPRIHRGSASCRGSTAGRNFRVGSIRGKCTRRSHASEASTRKSLEVWR
ncbi:hypothetical protein Y032_0131g1666 [Ancylostoma ceylanicum]|uniref:Uncharacterized protein n=1 Tax=Ancylostoma ceylanicum TaxID=53326 RepID=A0A016T7B7_9BILA|nr:hypothetical protein Y032_0131g1666 [Ancylostoma ceylanicum]